jgi:hypothetical protein
MRYRNPNHGHTQAIISRMIAWVVSAKAFRNETYGRHLTQAIKRAQ